MVVVPSLAEGERRQPGEVSRLIGGGEGAAAEEVTEGVDAEGDVVQEEDPHGPAPEQAQKAAVEAPGQRHPEREGEGQSEDGPEHEGAVDEAEDRVLQEVGRVALFLGWLAAEEHPADVGIEETAQGA